MKISMMVINVESCFLVIFLTRLVIKHKKLSVKNETKTNFKVRKRKKEKRKTYIVGT